METNKSTQINIVGNTMMWKSNYKRAVGKWWKRYFNKRVRQLDIIVE